MNWTGKKKIAFIPLYRTNAIPPDQIPANWETEIANRVNIDPGANGNDRSIQAWVRDVSSGIADVEAVVLPRRNITGQDIDPDALEGELGPTLRAQGFDHAAIVMLGGPGAGTNSGFWSRFVMKEGNGTWMMEILHGLTELKDFYHFPNDTDPRDRDIGSFDQMSAVAFTHLTSFNKANIGWLDRGVIAKLSNPTAVYDLHCVSSNQPPPEGRFAAVMIGDEVPYMIVEARKKNDQFDNGIASEGVIVYRVQTKNPYSNDRPGGLKPLYLITKTALKVGESATVDNGVTVTVTEAIDDGFKIRVNDTNRKVFDRTKQFGLPLAASPPSGSAIRGLGVREIAFRDSNRHLHEIWGNVVGNMGTLDHTGAAGAPVAKGTPNFYVDTKNLAGIMLFRGNDDNVRSLYHLNTEGAIGHDDLGGFAGAPKTASDPVGYFSLDTNTSHVIYRSTDGHLHELSWPGTDPVSYGGNLTRTISAPKALGQPSAYAVGNENNVIYRSTNGDILRLYWSAGATEMENLSSVAGTPRASGDPVGYNTSHNQAHQIVYLGNDRHIWELYWLGAAVVAGWDVTAASGAPLPVSGTTLSSYYSAATNTKHVMYRTSNGRLHEIWWVPGGSDIIHVDLTARFGLQSAADRPSGFTVEELGSQHLVYRGIDRHIYEVIW